MTYIFNASRAHRWCCSGQLGGLKKKSRDRRESRSPVRAHHMRCPHDAYFRLSPPFWPARSKNHDFGPSERYCEQLIHTNRRKRIISLLSHRTKRQRSPGDRNANGATWAPRWRSGQNKYIMEPACRRASRACPNTGIFFAHPKPSRRHTKLGRNRLPVRAVQGHPSGPSRDHGKAPKAPAERK